MEKNYECTFTDRFLVKYFNRHTVPGDGSCLYHAVNKANKVTVNMNNALLLRRRVSDYIKTHINNNVIKNPFRYITNDVNSLILTHSNNIIPVSEYNSMNYIKYIENFNVYGGELDIIILMFVTQRPIYVFMNGGTMFVNCLFFVHTFIHNEPIYLYFCGSTDKANHFELLIPKGEKEKRYLNSYNTAILNKQQNLKSSIPIPSIPAE